MSHYQIWMTVLTSPCLKAATWWEKQQMKYHTSFQLDLLVEYYRNAVIRSALDIPPHSGPIALAHGLPVPRGLLFWRCWLQLLPVDDPFIHAQLQFSHDFWMKTEKVKTVKIKNKKKGFREIWIRYKEISQLLSQAWL